MNYVIQFESIKDKKLGKVKEIIFNNKKKFRELKIRDLLFENKEPIYPGNGVYVFHNKRNVSYVGRSSSKSFVERIPAHLDLRGFAWFNTLLKKFYNQRESKNLKSGDFESKRLEKEAKDVIENFYLTLINIHRKHERVKEISKCLEKCLRLILEPKLNSYNNSSKKKYDFSDSDLLIKKLNDLGMNKK